ncbi:MAG: DUF6867 family protein [Alphaproteobacteria bacterium]
MIWEISFPIFLTVTIVLGGGASFMAGRAMAREWQPWLRLIVYIFLLCVAVRFFHFSLFGGTFLLPVGNIATSGYYFIVDFIVLLAIGALGRQITRADQMSTQYLFLYQRRGPVSWRRTERTKLGS